MGVDRKLVCAGVVFALIATVAGAEALMLSVGTPTHMGPGFFPLILSILLLIVGLTNIWLGVRAPIQVLLEPWPILQTVIVLAGVICFSALIEGRGLVPSVLAVIVLSCAARLRHRPLEVVAIAAVMLALSVGIFIYGIQLPIALW